ncbi:uncharacterized protein [Littorina saxatilis]|uniref:uncharacterized protein n=1 Tax=Littorina saxatilis TaxID=31220 RepID=UPI0038B57DF9
MTIPNTLSKKGSAKKGGGVSNGVSSGNAARAAVQQRSERTAEQSNSGCCRCCYLLIGAVILSFATTGAVLYYKLDGLNGDLHSFHDGDQVLARDISSDLDSVLCQAYTVVTDSKASVYLTDGPARVSTQAAETVVVRNPGLRAATEFDYRAFYLLPGSILEVGACMSVFNHSPRVHAQVLFIKGDKHFQDWRSDASCRHCVDHRVVIPPDALCEIGNAAGTQYVIDDKDTYYVVITRQHRSEDDVAFRAEIDMKVIKTVYDTSNVKEKCINTQTCKLNLTYHERDDVIIEFAYPYYDSPKWDTYFSTSCQLRRCFWITVFAIVPAGLVALMIVVCCGKGCVDRARYRKVQKKKASTKRAFLLTEDKNEPPV